MGVDVGSVDQDHHVGHDAVGIRIAPFADGEIS